ncbi:MAG: NAD(P)H-dependent oxidoreductase subunit E [Candidatus Gastranaerophilales bacterium]|nr:NAD(P)H-dependent oxidoreductase subunit E [Candidatus Gastranaerophilales bacterium]
MAELKSSVDFKKIDEILQEFGYEKTNLISVLQRIQGVYRYLPEDVISYVGEKVEGLSPATVHGVATFYAQFSLEPKGKYQIKVCDGTACHVRGSMPVLEELKKKLPMEKGKMTTKDGLFSLETVNCLGACGLAPAVVINEKVYPQMTPDAISMVIDTILKENNNGN